MMLGENVKLGRDNNNAGMHLMHYSGNSESYKEAVEDYLRLYRIDTNGDNLTQITQDKYISNCFFQNGQLFYSQLDEDGYVERDVIANPDGSNARTFEL